jgi:AbrB family looped-hinge helix DNA binding protein
VREVIPVVLGNALEEGERARRVRTPDRVRRPERDEESFRVADEGRSVSPKGQVTIPVAIRRLLGVEPGDKVAFSVQNGKVELRAVRAPIERSFQAIPALSPRRSWKEIERLAAEEQAERVAREGLE